jgi:hypothetical protein
MSIVRAADVAKQRLSIASRRLGTHDPVHTIGGLIDRSFELPLGDPRYARNHLTPGTLPLEHSFSESASSALRLYMQPLGPQASPLGRRQETSREMRRLVQQHYGRPALHWFDQQSEPFRGSTIHGNARFGAWFGAEYDEDGLSKTKTYYELPPGQVGDLPPNLQHAAQVAMACLPGLTPIFTSLTCGRSQGAQRVFFFHKGDLRLLDLEPLMNRLGIGSQLPAVLAAVGVILGGRFVLPEGSVLIGLRDTSRGIEMRLDTLVAGVPDPPEQLPQLIEMQLGRSPHSLRAYRHWKQAMTPDAYGSPGQISVVSVRANPQTPTRLSIYFRPAGYDRAPGGPRPGEISDAYALVGGASS